MGQAHLLPRLGDRFRLARLRQEACDALPVRPQARIHPWPTLEFPSGCLSRDGNASARPGSRASSTRQLLQTHSPACRRGLSFALRQNYRGWFLQATWLLQTAWFMHRPTWGLQTEQSRRSVTVGHRLPSPDASPRQCRLPSSFVSKGGPRKVSHCCFEGGKGHAIFTDSVLWEREH